MDISTSVPNFREFIAPMAAVLRSAATPLDIATITARVLAAMQLPPEALSVRHDDRLTEAEYRTYWARSYLNLAGLLTSPARGVWALAPSAPATIDGGEVVARVRAVRREAMSRRAPLEESANRTSVPESLADELRQLHDELLAQRGVRPWEELEGYYARFRERFGPQVLASQDGEALLETMHGRGTKDSLVYWLEFKDDEELPDLFGGIGGGSALKFGVYKAKETGQWMTGPATAMKVLSVAEAVALARSQRDAILAMVDVLEDASRDVTTIDYDAMALHLSQASSELCDLGWIHKILAMLFPRVLDDFHAVAYQAFHLIKLGKAPRPSLYANAEFFAGIARQVGIPITSLGSVLNHRNGAVPHGYWRIGTTVGTSGASEWPRMRDGNFVAVGWEAIPSLENHDTSKEKRAALASLMRQHYPSTPQAVNRTARELGKFAKEVALGDVIVTMQGKKVLGVGRVTGEYFHASGDGPFPHRRPVEWLDVEPWELFDAEGLHTTVYRFDKVPKEPLNLVAIEQHASMPLLEPDAEPKMPPPNESPSLGRASPPPLAPLAGLLGRIERVLERKGQLILHGPPGTGKTFWAMRAARAIVARSWCRIDWDALNDEQRTELAQRGAIETCCFHPSFGYEDFLEGLRPRNVAGQLVFEPRDGVFKSMCKRAEAQPDRRFVLIVDEINRGDTPRILGELLLVMEKDKRGTPVRLALTGDVLRVPSNLLVIGTMNTADRSIALLDAALRRRFGFVELMPEVDVLGTAMVGDLPLGPWLALLNARVQKHLKRDARNLQIGHAYLLHDGQPITDPARFSEVLREDIVPLLEEYYYDDFEALAEVLGNVIVRHEERRIDESLFRPGAAVTLLEALRKAYPELVASLATAGAEGQAADNEDEEDDDVGRSKDAA